MTNEQYRRIMGMDMVREEQKNMLFLIQEKHVFDKIKEDLDKITGDFRDVQDR